MHRRKINQPKEDLGRLLKSLATIDDKIWPYEKWPAIRFQDGLQIGLNGGHGRIRYTVVAFKEGEHATFEFTKPDGFIGTHAFSIQGLSENTTEIIHEIKMRTSTLKATFFWLTILKWLHDALIEDAFDKLENHFSPEKKETKYSIWVTFLRHLYKRKSFKSQYA